MRTLKFFGIFLLLLCLPFTILAHDELNPEIVMTEASDDLTLVGDVYPSDTNDAPVIILFHMLGSNRGAYDPIIPDLHNAGFMILNVDMRGHGDTGGSQVWDLAIEDVDIWVTWLQENEFSTENGLFMMGGSIGSNVALIGCANEPDCVGAIALSPGLDYRGLQPESSIIEGLAERATLLVASHNDFYSADSVQQMFVNAIGEISARIYRGGSHGTSLFLTDYESVSLLILSWLAEHIDEDET